jgi:hypothetical protein
MKSFHASDIAENHPIKHLFRTYAARGLRQAKLHDRDILVYLSDLLVEFVFVENLYSMRDVEGNRLVHLGDMLGQAMDSDMPVKKIYYKHIGDYTLFTLGMYPEHISRPGRAFSPSFYADTGRIGYHVAGELENRASYITVFRKLSDKFEHCVMSLNWVREYTTDPFYQLMLRNFDLS